MLKHISSGLLSILFIVLNMADAVLTNIGLMYGARELNPIIDTLINSFGIIALYPYKVLILIVFFYLIKKHSESTQGEKKYLVLGNVILFIVVCNNTVILLKYL